MLTLFRNFHLTYRNLPH